MKKLLAIFLALTLLLSFAACNKDGNGDDNTTTSAEQTTDNGTTNKNSIDDEISFSVKKINLNFLTDYEKKLTKIKSIHETDEIYPILPLFAWGKNKKFDFYTF